MKFRQHSDHTNEWMRFLHRQGRQVLIEQLVSSSSGGGGGGGGGGGDDDGGSYEDLQSDLLS